MQDFTAERFHPRPVDPARRAIGAGGKDQLRGHQGDGRARVIHLHRPARAVILRGGDGRAGPDIQLEQAGIGLKPVAHLILGGKDRPGFGEGQVGHVVIPDRIMQHEAAVAVAPTVAGAGVFFDTQEWHPQRP